MYITICVYAGGGGGGGENLNESDENFTDSDSELCIPITLLGLITFSQVSTQIIDIFELKNYQYITSLPSNTCLLLLLPLYLSPSMSWRLRQGWTSYACAPYIVAKTVLNKNIADCNRLPRVGVTPLKNDTPYYCSNSYGSPIDYLLALSLWSSYSKPKSSDYIILTPVSVIQLSQESGYSNYPCSELSEF